MKFNSEKEMYEYLVNNGDLYNKKTNHYVFVHNDAHALCVDVMHEEDIISWAKIALGTGASRISSVYAGGLVLYNPACSNYLKPSVTYCHDWYSSSDWVSTDEFFTLAEINQVEELNNNTPVGQIIDADTILADVIVKCDYEFTGFAQDIFNIWKNSSDKQAVEQMFYEFTDMEFREYLEKCCEKCSITI